MSENDENAQNEKKQHFFNKYKMIGKLVLKHMLKTMFIQQK